MNLKKIKKNKFFFVYILYNFTRDVSYVGYTNDIQKRLKAHNSGKGAKFTRGGFWNLIFFKKFKSKILAMQFEYKLKSDRKLRKNLVLKNKSIKFQ
jgi:putative endonuclease